MPDFLIWPETALPTYLAQEPQNMRKVVSLVDSLNIPLLTGIPFYRASSPGDYEYYNSAIFLKPCRPGYQLYSKIHLVPMSERVPYANRFKFIRQLNLGWGDFSPGDSLTIFDLDGFRFGTLICFESAFPGFARQFARNGAELLVVITNDMWFGRTSLYEQHAMMAVFRAIENRIPVVRAANTGISLAIDKWGRINARSGIFTRDYLIATVYPEKSHSVYGNVGDVIPQCATGVSIVSLGFAFLGRKRYNGEKPC
jgi:apolipoprotein N-acyltransferase